MLTEFVSTLLELRRKHPVFRRSKFLTGRPVGDTGIKDVTWLTPAGDEMSTPTGRRHHGRLGAVLFAARQPTTTSVEDDLFVILLNGDRDEMSIRAAGAAAARGAGRWCFDTARPETVESATVHHRRQALSRFFARSFVLLHDA